MTSHFSVPIYCTLKKHCDYYTLIIMSTNKVSTNNDVWKPHKKY